MNELRDRDTFIPELSLVAEDDDGKLIGQVVLSKTNITTSEETITELLLSPICVHPDYFRRGIARALMDTVFKAAKGMGYTAVFLCGDPQFYNKIGFVPTYEHNISHISDADGNAEWCMVRELVDGTPKGYKRNSEYSVEYQSMLQPAVCIRKMPISSDFKGIICISRRCLYDKTS